MVTIDFEKFRVFKTGKKSPFYILLLTLGLTTCSAQQDAYKDSVSLFNGIDLQGWQNFGNGEFFVQDGVIVGDQHPDCPIAFWPRKKCIPTSSSKLNSKSTPY